jgi:predicted Zn-dependent peptidase
VESEKGFLRDAIRAKINNPRGYALAECRKLLFAGEPFALSLLGEEETLGEIDAALMTHHHERFAGELIPTFFYAGSTPADEVAGLIAQYFPRLAGKRHAYQCIVSPHAGEARFAEEEMPVCQGKLAMGFRTDVTVGHPLEAATMVLNEIYGGSPASKLFLNVRERLGLCYHCSSAWHGYKGVMFASAGMKPDHFEVTMDAMLREFDAVTSGNITNTELEAAKRSIAHHFRQLWDNPAALCGIYANRGEAGDLSPIEGLADAVARTTRADVVEAAAHLTRGATFFLRGTDEGEEADE